MSTQFSRANRLQQLPPYLFAELDRRKQEARKKGVDLIDLGVGDPDLPTPGHIVEALHEAASDPVNHRYPSYEGLLEFRQAAADWYQKRFGVRLDPEREVLSLIGSKEGIGHIPLAFVNPGDVVLVPDPAYPVYQAGTVFAGATPYYLPLLEENDYLADLKAIPAEVLKKAKLLFLNYPNNPTAAVASKEFFAEAVAFALGHNLILCHDAAYSEIAYDGYEPSSILAIDGAKDVAVEFHSLSKAYNMAGWRIGFAVGNHEVLAGLGAIKTNLDSGIFQAIQYGGIAALRGPQDYVARMRQVYQERRDALVEGLAALGWRVKKPRASFYVWIPVPKGFTSTELAATLLSEAGIVSTPGIGFGRHGEGYIRVALTVDVARIQEAVERIKRLGIRG
ncbi:MAG: LL-diaminopimelate aminotransferase [candidate division NC10 bacterium]|nr:LL-diaminopimelate aminotransferase [candidate division NC10 bacterium]